MTAKNDITGDSLQTKTATDAYRDGWDRIFGQRKKAEAALQEMADFSQKHGLYDVPLTDSTEKGDSNE